MKHIKFYIAMITGFLLGAATLGCHSSSSAADTDSAYATVAQLNALKAQLRTQVVQLRPATSMTTARALAFGTVATAAPSAVTVTTVLGTSCGFDGTITTATHECVMDSQGAFVILPYPSGTANSYEIISVLYANADCTGQAYITLGPATTVGVPATGSFNFRSDPKNLGPSDGSTYYHLDAGAQYQANADPQSESDGAGQCAPSGASGISFAAIPVTPGTAGTWPSAPIGPYSAGTPQ